MPDNTIAFPDNTRLRGTTMDLGPFYGLGIDAIVDGLKTVTRTALGDGRLSPTTVYAWLSMCRTELLPWLSAAATTAGRALEFQDVDAKMLESFASDLHREKGYTTAAQIFSNTMSVLQQAARLGLSRPVAEIRPANPFPHRHAAQQATRPYSKRERTALLGALADDLEAIRAGREAGMSAIEPIVVYLLLMAFRSGFNATPLLEISRDAMRPHPLRKDIWTLVSYKRRAASPVQASVRWSDSIEQFATVPSDLLTLYRELLVRTEPYVQVADPQHADLAFLRPPLAPRCGAKVTGKAVPLTIADVTACVHERLVRRYALTTDDGKPLVPSMRRMRATLASRVFELSGGDPFVVAKILNNAPKTTQLHYLEPDADAPMAFATALRTLQSRLQDPTPQQHEKTPVGGCTDPLKGRYAPGDGVTYCQRWMNCFKCPNQCVTGADDDLWRLYSFYWLLQANAQRLRRMPISGLFRFVVHVIDTVISEKYGEAAARARTRARETPHPFWAHVRMDDLLFAEVRDAR